MEWRFYDIFYFVCETFCCKDMTLPILGQFWKNALSHRWQLYTVTQDDYELMKAAHVFGWWWEWRENQNIWDGQGITKS